MGLGAGVTIVGGSLLLDQQEVPDCDPLIRATTGCINRAGVEASNALSTVAGLTLVGFGVLLMGLGAWGAASAKDDPEPLGLALVPAVPSQSPASGLALPSPSTSTAAHAPTTERKRKSSLSTSSSPPTPTAAPPPSTFSTACACSTKCGRDPSCSPRPRSPAARRQNRPRCAAERLETTSLCAGELDGLVERADRDEPGTSIDSIDSPTAHRPPPR